MFKCNNKGTRTTPVVLIAAWDNIEILLHGNSRFTDIQNCIILKFAINIIGSKILTGSLF